MIRNLNYVDMSDHLGAGWGIVRYRADTGIGYSDLGVSFAYGRDETELQSDVGRIKAGVDYFRQHPNEHVGPLGFAASRRSVIVHMMTNQCLEPKTLVAVEIYPPFDDADEQDQHEKALLAYMEAADTTDRAAINQKLAVLGLNSFIQQ